MPAFPSRIIPLQQVVLQPEPHRVAVGVVVEERSIDPVRAARIDRRADEQIEVADQPVVPIRLRQDDRLLAVDRIAVGEQRLQLAAEIEARQPERVHLFPTVVAVERRVRGRMHVGRAVVVLVGRQRLERIERRLVADAARQSLRPRHAWQTPDRLDQVEADHAPPDRTAAFDPTADQ